MALNPTISLQGAQVAPFDPVGSIGKAVSLKKLMTEQAFMEREKESALESQRLQQENYILGNQAQVMKNEQEARELAAKKAAAGLAKKYSKVGPKGEITIDFDGAINDGISQGHDISTLHGLMAKQAEIGGKKIANVEQAQAAAQKQYDWTMNLIRNAPPEQVPGILHVAKTGIDQLTRNVMSPEESAQFSTKMFGMPEEGVPKLPDGKPDWAPIVASLKGRAEAHAKSTISPQQAIVNQQTQESLAQGGAGSGTGPEYRDPTSKISKDARAVLAKQGIVVPSGMSHAALMNNPQYKGILEQSVVPAGVKAAGITGGIEFENKAKTLDNLARAAKAAKLPTGLTIAAIINKTFDTKILNDPTVAEYVARVQEANAAGVPIPENNPQAVASYATENAKVLRAQGKTAGGATGAPTFVDVAPASPTAPTKPVGQPVGTPWTSPDGKKYMKIKPGPDSDKSTWMVK